MPIRVPEVNQANEFKEIANDFTNPLELIREAISNSFDSGAENITLLFDVINIDGEDTFRVIIRDDGDGMDDNDLNHFFDLGNSSRRTDPSKIGEKGHDTKVYFNSKRLELRTKKNGNGLKAKMENIFQSLNRGQIPNYEYDYIDIEDFDKGTEIIIYGYNQQRYSVFTEEILIDYIYWKTKFGSVEKEFSNHQNNHVKIHVKGLNKDCIKTLDFGHIFPDESQSANKLFETFGNSALDRFCKKWIYEDSLPNFPHIKYQAVFYVEGKLVKYDYNNMLRRPTQNLT